MKYGISVGTDERVFEGASKAIRDILDSARSDDVVKHALSMLAQTTKPEMVTIQNCVIKGGATINVDKGEDEDYPLAV